MVFGSFGDQAPEHRMINDMENAQSGKCSHLFSFVSRQHQMNKVGTAVKNCRHDSIAILQDLSVRRRFSPVFLRRVCDRAILFLLCYLLLRVVG
jgi:hypothetical protein